MFIYNNNKKNIIIYGGHVSQSIVKVVLSKWNIYLLTISNNKVFKLCIYSINV